jgi:predicted ATPase/DNA-binding CsgD family transcriptional regulator
MRGYRLSNRKPPVVRQGLLYTAGDQVTPALQVESAEWFNWLAEQSSFRVETTAISFTVRRKERSNGSYWYAYWKHQGKLSSTYLGKSEDVTLARLNAVAAMLPRPDGALVPAPGRPTAARLPARSDGTDQATSDYGLTPPPPLPVPFTSLVDRVEDVQGITALLHEPEVRLVSLIGAGGIGKTRIALQVAARLQADFTDGIYFLALDSVRDAQLVLTTVAHALGLPADSYRSVAQLLKECLLEKQILLLLDNLEQVVAAAPLLVDVLNACPDLKMLLTSREVLHLSGEHPWVVAPLLFPDPVNLPAPDRLLRYPAVELFVQRAQLVWPGLPLDVVTLQAIAHICARLEGLPLAIELAAARVRVLSPGTLLERLEHSLAVLTQGGPDRPARQQTLRATLDWSHDLLSPDEQLVLRRLSVFAGGCILEAAEAVCAAPGDIRPSLLEVVASLIDKSLLLPVNSPASQPRLRLAETVREYALESLVRSDELAALEEAHAAYYLALALQAAPELDGRQQDSWLARLDQEYLNLTAALNYLLSHQDPARAVQLTGALGRYWYTRGRLSEGLNWTEQALRLRPRGVIRPEDRRALFAAGLFAIHLDQGERARVWLEESMNLSTAAADQAGFVRAGQLLMLFFLLKGNLAAAQAQADVIATFVCQSADPWVLASAEGTAGALSLYLGDFPRARLRLERSEALYREAGDRYLSELTLLLVADTLAATGDKTQAQVLLDGQIQSLEARHVAWPAGYILCAYGQFALRRGDWARARVLLDRSLQLFSRLRDARGVARACLFLAQTAFYQQDYTTALALALRCLKNAQAAGAVATMIGCLEELADAAVRRGKAGWAVRLWGAGARQRDAVDPQQRPVEPAERTQLQEAARAALGAESFAAAWDAGRRLPLEQLLSPEHLAHSVLEHQARAAKLPAGLTRRELEVLLLVADGLSNTEIAERLVISANTVVSYLNLIYRKLDVSSRTAAMRYVIDHQLNEPGVG